MYLTCRALVWPDGFNPLTPVPAVTGRDKPWPFFYFWRHLFWPKLASPILNFCRRKRSCQWCPDQSDRPNGAWDMHKNDRKAEWKTQSKISCHYTWRLYRKNCPCRWHSLRSYLTASKPSRRSITAAKRKEKEKKERQKDSEDAIHLDLRPPWITPSLICRILHILLCLIQYLFN